MSLGETKEFYVAELRAREVGAPLVIGVPNNGLPICIGDVFRGSHSADAAKDEGIGEGARPQPILLTVVSISYPRQNIEQLPAGHTGALVLAGDGFEAVSKGRLLRT